MLCTLTALVAFTPGAGWVSSGTLSPKCVCKLLERPQIAEVEDRAEVDVEAFGALTREHLAAAAEGRESRRRRARRSRASTAGRCCTAGTTRGPASSVTLGSKPNPNPSPSWCAWPWPSSNPSPWTLQSMRVTS